MSNEPRKLLKFGSLTVLFGCLALAGCGSTTAGSASEEPSTQTASPTQSASPESSSPQASAPESSASPTAAASSSAAGESEQTETIGGQELGKLPSNATEYADALVVAWGNGNQAQMEQLATVQVIASLTEYSEQGGAHWSQTGSDAGAGSVFVSYENAEDGSVLNLRVQNQVVGQGHEQGVVEANFE